MVGGLGSHSGAVIASVLFVLGSEALRVVEEPFSIGALQVPGIPGMRMVIFSLLLVGVMIFARRGIMGREELSWEKVVSLGRRVLRRSGGV